MNAKDHKKLRDIYKRTGEAFRVLGFEPHPPGINYHMHLIEVGDGLPLMCIGDPKPRRLARLVGKSADEINGDRSRTSWPRLAEEGRLFWFPLPDKNGLRPGSFVILSADEDSDGGIELEMDIVKDLARDHARKRAGRQNDNLERQLPKRNRNAAGDGDGMDMN